MFLVCGEVAEWFVDIFDAKFIELLNLNESNKVFNRRLYHILHDSIFTRKMNMELADYFLWNYQMNEIRELLFINMR